MKKIVSLIGLSFVFIGLCCSQNLTPFFIDNSAEVRNSENNLFKNPFAGGFNSPQISPIDLNNDGIKDLFVFDKKSGKWTTFLNGGKAGEVDYFYSPEFEALFPQMKNWTLLVDYNNDGLEDIFTHSPSGVLLFKSAFVNDVLTFNLVDTLFYKSSNGIRLNIYVSPTDIPAITDVNGDGDLDVLAFDQFGMHVQYYENLAIENNLEEGRVFFELTNPCWGNFVEDTNNADIHLNISCKGGNNLVENYNTKHVGSTLLAFDIDGDKDKELLIGDVGAKYLTFLLNGGDTTNADITEANPDFPESAISFDNYFFPAAYHLDVDNDCLLDLVASHNTTAIAEDRNHIWWYKNIGDEKQVQLQFKQQDFLLDEIIDVGTVAAPATTDINNDGKADLIIGNYYSFDKSDSSNNAQLAAYLNVSTNSKIMFKLFDDDFGNLSTYKMAGIYPAFGDMDNDGDDDMICSTEQGFFHYFKNNAFAGEIMRLELEQLNIDSLAEDARPFPFLYDYNEDGLLDIITGTRSGTLNFIKNTGDTSMVHLETDTKLFGNVKVDVSSFLMGYSAPLITDFDGIPHLIVHSNSGGFYVFNDLKKTSFSEVELSFPVSKGGGGIAISDFNNDGFLEIVAGTQTGGIQLFSQKEAPSVPINFAAQHCNKDTITSINVPSISAINFYPNPAKTFLYIVNSQSLQLDYEIFNVNGELVLANNLISNIINIAKLPKGIYFSNMKNIDNEIVFRFVKQ